MKFGISLLVKKLDKRRKSQFKFKLTEAMKKAKVDLERDDTLINYSTVDSMAMNGGVSWWGPRKKDARLLQFIIEGTTNDGDIVLDNTGATGKVKLKEYCFHLLIFEP
jgi:predicted metal-dependent RNase